MTAPLAGYRVLVTGGATGIGAACAARLVTDGAAVTICGRTEATLAQAADTIGGAGAAGTIDFVVADVTVEDDVARAVDAAGGTGRLDGIVANAGGGGALNPYHRQDTDDFLRVLHLNVLGTMLLVKHGVTSLAASGRGSFVAMSSLAGHVTHRWFGAYPVAKAGVEEMMRNAADEYGPVRVRFNAVSPGFTATELMSFIPTESEVYRSYVDNTPMGGVGEPRHVADVVRFLLGPDSSWVNGQVLDVDGGHHLRRGPDYTEFVVPSLADDPLLGGR